jgi:probable rRNA maturation factor
VTGSPQRRHRLTIDIVRPSSLWRSPPGAEKTVRGALAAAADLSDPKPGNVEVAVVLADDEFVADLNRIWRGRDTPTNVLSFPAPASPALSSSRMLGDIVIAYETVAREAAAEKKPFLDHLAHLTVHGFLHLLGHDHVSEQEAETMEGMERTILAELGIGDPYAAPARPTTPRSRVING